MKIKRITLYNIGPYVGKNTFEFSIDRDKNIVLIGGKNGAGKTTFFKAIKTCLYGCKVWGFDSPGKDYYSLISSLVNFKTAYDNNSCAFIEIELVFDDGKEVDCYTLHREWKKTKMTLVEFFNIHKNGGLIIGTEENDFINYLLSVIPPDMFNFYFFDGESIAEFFLGTDGNKNFRNAFLKLYGLDTLSIMVENFARNIKKKDAKKSGYTEYQAAKSAMEKARSYSDSIRSDIKDLENRIDLCQIKLNTLTGNYSKEGGISLVDWKELNSQILKEENVRDNLNRWLKEIANHYLPFILLEKNLLKLLSELSEARENRKVAAVIDMMQNDDFANSINQFLAEKEVLNLTAVELVNLVKQNFTIHDDIYFDYSESQSDRLIAQIYEKLDFDKKQIKKVLMQINASLKTSKRLREQLISSNVDGYEEYVEERDKIEKTIAELTISLERRRLDLDKQSEVYEQARICFEKNKSAYEELLKAHSITNLAERAVAVYSLLEEKLVRRQATKLQEAFMESFSSIINKGNFVDGILIDNNINVIPYKYIGINRTQLQNYRDTNKEFLSLYNNVQLIVDMNKLEFGEVQRIQVPSPIKVPFSQGERQVYIMSIYLALLKTSRQDIPFFIDTPFARIDSNHRENIVAEFFNKVKNQLFILSTDEEIVGSYKKKMENKISNTFTLAISGYGATTILPNEYFGD